MIRVGTPFAGCHAVLMYIEKHALKTYLTSIQRIGAIWSSKRLLVLGLD
jgi:hypothetical protein